MNSLVCQRRERLTWFDCKYCLNQHKSSNSQAVQGRYVYRSFFFSDHWKKQIDSMLLWVCSVIDHRRRQNVLKTSVTQVKQVIASFRCYDNSDAVPTLIITNFRLYLIQLWWQFFQNFVYGDVIYAQTWEVLALKNCIEPP